MIQTKNKVVYEARGNKQAKVFIEIIHQTDDIDNEQYVFIISDFIKIENETKIEINRKSVTMSYVERDNLKQYVMSQNSFVGSESEVNKKLLSHALLVYVCQDYTKDEFGVQTNKLIYNTTPLEWEISN